MKTSKCLTAICAIALLAGATQLRAETEAQAKARQALEQKMRELEAQPPAKAAPPARVKRPAPVVATPAAPARPEPPPPPVAPPPPADPVPVAAAPPTEAGFAPAPPASDTPEVERARAALHEKMMQLNAQNPGTSAGIAVTARPPAVAFKSLEAPASPISGSKESRLAGLLQRYKSDEISPEEYHKQRASILAEP